MKGIRRIGGPLALAAAALLSVLALPGTGAAASGGPTQTVQNVAPGVTLTRITDPAGPYHVYVLAIDPAAPSTLDVATPSREMGTYATPSQIGAARGAVAAINGDFSINPGRPLHTLTADGSVEQSGMQNGPSFAVSQDETHSFIGDRALATTGHRLDGGRTFKIWATNGHAPDGGQITAYTPYGGWADRPPARACSVRLKRPGRFHWGADGAGVVRDWVVSRSVCSDHALSVLSGTVVLSARRTGAGARTLRRMTPGNMVRLTWSFGWADVMDSVGGMPVLVRDGQALPAACSSYFCSPNPRTGIGITADGHILLVVADGRSDSSVGMTLQGFARYMVSLGAVDALNLDGGGGSAMWVDGLGVVNHPSDFWGERPVTNAVVLLPGADPREVLPLPYSDSPSVGRVGTHGPGRAVVGRLSRRDRRAMTLASNDPASTGGLMQALADGGV